MTFWNFNVIAYVSCCRAWLELLPICASMSDVVILLQALLLKLESHYLSAEKRKSTIEVREHSYSLKQLLFRHDSECLVSMIVIIRICYLLKFFLDKRKMVLSQTLLCGIRFCHLINLISFIKQAGQVNIKHANFKYCLHCHYCLYGYIRMW